MNIFNDAIDAHADWKLKLKKHVEQGQALDILEVTNSHACTLGKWIDGEGNRYSRLPSFETMRDIHEQFHRAAAEIVQCFDAGEKTKAMSLLSPEGNCARISSNLIRALMECSKELSTTDAKGVQNSGRVRDLLAHKGIHEVLSIQSSSSVLDALTMMVERNIGALVVNRGNTFLGIFTERGFAQSVVSKGINSLDLPISDMVDADTFSVDPNDSVEECMTLMTATHKRHLPVMEQGKPVGIISIGDVIKQVISEDRHTREQLEGYIHGQYGGAVG